MAETKFLVLFLVVAATAAATAAGVYYAYFAFLK